MATGTLSEIITCEHICAAHKCRLTLYCVDKELYVNMIQQCCCLLCAKAHLKCTQSGKLLCGKTN